MPGGLAAGGAAAELDRQHLAVEERQDAPQRPRPGAVAGAGTRWPGELAEDPRHDLGQDLGEGLPADLAERRQVGAALGLETSSRASGSTPRRSAKPRRASVGSPSSA